MGKVRKEPTVASGRGMETGLRVNPPAPAAGDQVASAVLSRA